MSLTRYLALALALSVSGCASPQAEAEPATALAPGLAFPDFGLPEGDDPLSLDDALALSRRMEQGWPPPAGDRLRQPKTLDDVQTILELDQYNLYEAALGVTATEGDVRAVALEAQIELAWGETFMILMEVLIKLGQHFDRRLMPLEQETHLTPRESALRTQLRRLTDQNTRLVEAFQLLASEHISKGSQKSNEVIERAPDNYLGYRLAADYYRTVRKWNKFDAMVKKIELINPDSNGLIFLRGTAAFYRQGDPDAAAEYYRTALSNDPDFVRAQAHLILIQEDLSDLYEEYTQMKLLNPNHPIIRWVGPLIELARRG